MVLACSLQLENIELAIVKNKRGLARPTLRRGSGSCALGQPVQAPWWASARATGVPGSYRPKSVAVSAND